MVKYIFTQIVGAMLLKHQADVIHVHGHVKISRLHRSIPSKTTILQKNTQVSTTKHTHAHFSPKAEPPEAFCKTRRRVQCFRISGFKMTEPRMQLNVQCAGPS